MRKNRVVLYDGMIDLFDVSERDKLLVERWCLTLDCECKVSKDDGVLYDLEIIGDAYNLYNLMATIFIAVDVTID